MQLFGLKGIMKVLKLRKEQIELLRKALTKEEFETIMLLQNNYENFMSKLFVFTAHYYDVVNDKTTDKYNVLDGLYTELRLQH